MSSKRLEDLSHAMMICCAEFEEQLRVAGIDFVRACTYRSSAEQGELYKFGRTAPGTVRTNARGGQSLHNRTENGMPSSDAADYYPLVHGKLCGTTTDADIALYRRVGLIARACGLEWGGDWPGTLRDLGHFQLPQQKLAA